MMPDRHGGSLADRGEVWRPIPGHPGCHASSLGRVRSPRGTILTPVTDRDGYLRVKLRGRLVGVHVAVCLAFHGKAEVRHLNGDKGDNRPRNVAWGSHWKNEQDKKKGREEESDRPYPPGTRRTSDLPR